MKTRLTAQDTLVVILFLLSASQMSLFAVDALQISVQSPNVGVVPKLQPKEKLQPEVQFVGSIRTTPFTPAYSNAFMKVVLSQINNFAKTLNLSVDLPITLSQCANIDGGFLRGELSVQVILDNDDRFLFEHGYVSLYAAHDNYFWGVLGGQRAVDKADLYGTNVASKAEMVQIVRDVINKLGYTDKLTLTKREPDAIIGDDPRNPRAKYFTRYQIGWDDPKIPGMVGFNINAEVDAKTKTLKILYLDNTNLWRKPPKIDVSPELPATK